MKRRSIGPGWFVAVTGASSGLGRCLALELARLGCGLVLTGRDEARLQAVAAEARDAGAPTVEVEIEDLAVVGGAQRLGDRLARREPAVDALVNNAGAGRAGAWSEGSDEGDQGLFRLLVEAPMVLTRALIPGWRARGQGALLNVASTGAFQPGPQTAVYYAAKAALASWSLALAREEQAWLTVTTLCPGALKTEFSSRAGKRDVPGAPGPESTSRAAIRAWRNARGLVVPGISNKLMVFMSRLLPPSLVAAGVEAVQLSVKKR